MKRLWLGKDGGAHERKDAFTARRCLCETTGISADHHGSAAAKLVCIVSNAWARDCSCIVVNHRIRLWRNLDSDVYRWPQITDDFAKYVQCALNNGVYWKSVYVGKDLSTMETARWTHKDRAYWFRHPTKRGVRLKTMV